MAVELLDFWSNVTSGKVVVLAAANRRSSTQIWRKGMRIYLAEILWFGVFLIGPGIPAATAQHGGHGGGGGGDMSMPSVPSVRTGKVKGRLVQLSSESITVETEKKGRTERLTYMLNARTKRKGDLESGTEVVVKYREEPGAPVATSVEAKKPKKGTKAGG